MKNNETEHTKQTKEIVAEKAQFSASLGSTLRHYRCLETLSRKELHWVETNPKLHLCPACESLFKPADQNQPPS